MLNKILITSGVVLLISCGPSPEEKRQEAERVAAVTCAIMSETRNMDASVRVEKMNEAREKIGGQPYLRGDEVIKEAFEYGLCQELVLNENFDESIQPIRDEKREQIRIVEEQLRVEAEKRAEGRRLKEAKRREEDRKAAEKQRIADSKPSVKEEFHFGTKVLRKRTHYQAKNDGGKKHGLEEQFYDDGRPSSSMNYKDGERDGLELSWFGNRVHWRLNWKDGKKHGLSEYIDYKTGEFESAECYDNGRLIRTVYEKITSCTDVK
jgi:antitoxin component YwqK of YwqJK toxin-antitoxin module